MTIAIGYQVIDMHTELNRGKQITKSLNIATLGLQAKRIRIREPRRAQKLIRIPGTDFTWGSREASFGHVFIASTPEQRSVAVQQISEELRRQDLVAFEWGATGVAESGRLTGKIPRWAEKTPGDPADNSSVRGRTFEKPHGSPRHCPCPFGLWAVKPDRTAVRLVSVSGRTVEEQS